MNILQNDSIINTGFARLIHYRLHAIFACLTLIK